MRARTTFTAKRRVLALERVAMHVRDEHTSELHCLVDPAWLVDGRLTYEMDPAETDPA